MSLPVSSGDELQELLGWSLFKDKELDADNNEVAAFPTAAAAPTMTKAKSLGKGMMSSDELNVESVDSTTSDAPAMAAKSTTNAVPAHQAKQVCFTKTSSTKVSLISDEASVTSNLGLHSSAPITVH